MYLHLEKEEILRLRRRSGLERPDPRSAGKQAASGGAAERFATVRDDVHGLAKWSKDSRHRRAPSGRSTAAPELQDLVAALVLPARAAALHADADQ